METIETADIALIMSSITAIAAVIIPVISTAITLRHNEKLKRTELHSPKIYEAVNQLVGAYSNLMRYDDPNFSPPSGLSAEDHKGFIRNRNQATYIQFMTFKTACYEIISLIPNAEIHNDLLALLVELERFHHCPDEEHDQLFYATLAKIALVISPKQSNTRKPNRTNRKAKSGKETGNSV